MPTAPTGVVDDDLRADVLAFGLAVLVGTPERTIAIVNTAAVPTWLVPCGPGGDGDASAAHIDPVAPEEHIAPVPRISIQAFCVSADTAAAASDDDELSVQLHEIP